MNPFPKLAHALSHGQRKAADPKDGWLFLRYGRVAHYLKDGITLCGKFRVEGKPFVLADFSLVPAWANQPRCTVCKDFASDRSAE